MPDLAVSNNTEIIVKVQKTAEILTIFNINAYGEQTMPMQTYEVLASCDLIPSPSTAAARATVASTSRPFEANATVPKPYRESCDNPDYGRRFFGQPTAVKILVRQSLNLMELITRGPDFRVEGIVRSRSMTRRPDDPTTVYIVG